MSEAFKKYKKYVGCIYRSYTDKYNLNTRSWEKSAKYTLIINLIKSRGLWKYKVETIPNKEERTRSVDASHLYFSLENKTSDAHVVSEVRYV